MKLENMYLRIIIIHLIDIEMAKLITWMDKMIINGSRYYQPEKRDMDWGLYVLGTGSKHAVCPEVPNPGRILNDYALVYLLRGEGVYYSSPEHAVRVKAGDLLVLFPGVWHKYHPERGGSWDEYWIIYNGGVMEHLLEKQYFSPEKPVLCPGLDCRLIEQFGNILAMSGEAAPPQPLRLAAAFYEILCRIETVLHVERRGGFPTTMEKAAIIIEKAAGEKINISRLAASLGYSYSHFRRRFREFTGLSPHQYELSSRVNKAKTLLSENQLSIKEIAEKLGFDDQYYFSRLFRRKTGTAPSQWKGL